jgi:16S rRNA (adenine1518-N6/adenine1519-N6)-dimethyltransferase
VSDFRPSKDRGQNFLVDRGVARRFVEVLGPGPEDVVLEVGPGKGALTEPLLATGCRVVAVEIEAPLADELAGRGEARLEVLKADFLRVPMEDLLPHLEPEAGGRVLALSNVPYSVTGPVMGRLASGELPLERLVVGVQREVADRLVAGPGSKQYGRLSLLAAAWGRWRRAFKIGAGAYRPRPKVLSAALVGERDPDREPIRRGSPLDRVVRAAFAQRRKTLRNTLSGGLGLEKSGAEALLAAAGVDPGLRAEAVDLEGFRRLAEALSRAAPEDLVG